mmetsp:Transcript_76516/g.88949  ORF Transcript_76516/g.88949 Transcript_76516/m.88949 type:complete len:359 (+) Transcript_76516:34-1110(+)
MEATTIKLPGIVSDVDGVIVKGSKGLPGSDEAVKILKTPLGKLNPEKFGTEESTLPLVCLSNVGEYLEEDRANCINESLGLKDTPFQILGNQMVLNYSCLRPVFANLKDKTVIVSGLGEIARSLKSVGLENYLTLDEYLALYPHASHSYTFYPQTTPSDDLVEEVRKRLGMTKEELLKEPVEIHAIFFMMSPDKWEDNIQILCDLIGKHKTRNQSGGLVEEQMPVYFGCTDLYLLTDYGPKISIGFFKDCIEHCYKKMFGKDLISEVTGKPAKAGYEYSKVLLQNQTKYQIENYYMIGDNPKTDIRGAAKLGWKTILVKSGVFGGTLQNDAEDPADYVVESMLEAIKLILRIEGIANL